MRQGCSGICGGVHRTWKHAREAVEKLALGDRPRQIPTPRAVNFCDGGAYDVSCGRIVGGGIADAPQHKLSRGGRQARPTKEAGS